MRKPLRLALLAGIWLGLSLPLAAQDAPIVTAFAAAESGDWAAAYAVIGSTDPLARDLLTWSRLRQDGGTFEDYVAFLTSHGDWPGLDRLRAKGEPLIPEDADPASVLAYFGPSAPQTGEGATRLVTALRQLGQADRADAVLRKAWLELDLTEAGEAAMLGRFGDSLAPLDVARADEMLWRDIFEDAERLLPRLPDDQRKLAEARIALGRDSDDVVERLWRVPNALAGSPGLAYDRASRLANRGDREEAVAIILDRSTSAGSLGRPERWALWRENLARRDLREGRPERAYRLASAHFLTGGSGYADLEWLSGYIALRGLEDPETALTHFRAFEASVTDPVSLGRAGYWTGRAEAAAGRPDAARAAYERAARYQTGFYGLLAAEELGIPLDPALAASEPIPPLQQAEFLTEEIPRAALMLVVAGQRSSAVVFFLKLGRELDQTRLVQMGAVLEALHEPYFAMVMAREAEDRGIELPELLYPLHDLRLMDMGVGPELALSIARRESMFNPLAGSSAGAQGLMQLMPGTAQDIAAKLGLDYDRARLTRDWQFNATLAASYLGDLRARFGDSPVLIASGYNAGPRRPAEWITERGDPRSGVDVVDWIEDIPFRETRVYVQRVTEAVPIYAARLGEISGPLQFRALLEGNLPLLRPAVAATGTTLTRRRPELRPGG